MKIYYFGYSLAMLECLIEFSKNTYDFEFQGVITQTGKYKEEFIDMCQINKLSVDVISDKNELNHIYEQKNIKNVIMYEFGIIIPENICKEAVVINFHPGSLKTNRGANPINWSILIPEIGAEICAYKILPQIDCGNVISYKNEQVTLSDTPYTLKQKLEKNIPIMIKDVYEYLIAPEKDKTQLVEGGIYRKRVCKEDYTINLDNDKTEIIIRKINSQKDYNGAILYANNKEYRIVDYELLTKRLMLYTNEGQRFIKEEEH